MKQRLYRELLSLGVTVVAQQIADKKKAIKEAKKEVKALKIQLKESKDDKTIKYAYSLVFLESSSYFENLNVCGVPSLLRSRHLLIFAGYINDHFLVFR